jgi:hypothetical protein
MEFKSRIITYGELRQGLHFDNDKFGIASYEYETRRRTFLSNPCAGKDDDVYMYLVLADDIPVGRTMLFDTRLKVDKEIFPLHSGSGLMVEENFRKYGIGAEIFTLGGVVKNRNLNLSAGISDMALPLYKRLKYNVFALPRLHRFCDSKPLLGRFGVNRTLQTILCPVINATLHLLYTFTSIKAKKLKKQYVIEKVESVPLWVDEIVLNDGHKYAEVHDHNWLQWNLDNNYKGHERDIQSFFVIWRNDKPFGFVMTKERFKSDVHGMKNVMTGSIVEWGSKDENVLSESNIYRLILDTFSKDIDIIETATDNVLTIHELKRIGFFRYGDAHIAFQDKTKQMKDSCDASLWRLRYGYADVILS